MEKGGGRLLPGAAMTFLICEDGHEYTERFQRFLGAQFQFLRAQSFADAVRQAPAWLRVGPVDDLVNTIEYFIHAEDVRRPNRLPARPMPAEFERWIWRRLSRQARLSFRRVPARVRLVRP